MIDMPDRHPSLPQLRQQPLEFTCAASGALRKIGSHLLVALVHIDLPPSLGPVWTRTRVAWPCVGCETFHTEELSDALWDRMESRGFDFASAPVQHVSATA